MLSAVQSDKQSIGYISLGSVNDSVKVVKVAGVAPSKQTVLDGTYKIQRPFVFMTNSKTELSARVADFMKYVKSDALEAICDSEDVGTIFLSDGAKRANEGKDAIEVGTYENNPPFLTVTKSSCAARRLWKTYQCGGKGVCESLRRKRKRCVRYPARRLIGRTQSG